MHLRPRFSLRTLFVLVTIIALPMGWVAYQLNWIRQRHEFLQAHDISDLCFNPQPAPWHLRIFGEHGYEHQAFMVQSEHLQQAVKLFPEVNRFEVVQFDLNN